jgi:hypothetical protein
LVFLFYQKLFLLEEKPKQEEVKEIIAEPKKIQCNTHLRFKKSCPICVEAVK